MTCASTIHAPVFLRFNGAGERFGDEVPFQLLGRGRDSRRDAGGFCEEVDEFEDEELRECAA